MASLLEQVKEQEAIKENVKIEKIVADKNLRQKLIKNGKNTVKDRSWKSIEKEIINVYMGTTK